MSKRKESKVQKQANPYSEETEVRVANHFKDLMAGKAWSPPPGKKPAKAA